MCRLKEACSQSKKHHQGLKEAHRPVARQLQCSTIQYLMSAAIWKLGLNWLPCTAALGLIILLKMRTRAMLPGGSHNLQHSAHGCKTCRHQHTQTLLSHECGYCPLEHACKLDVQDILRWQCSDINTLKCVACLSHDRQLAGWRFRSDTAWKGMAAGHCFW